MTVQPSLFDPPAARLSDPETSWMAAVEAIGRAQSHRVRALAALDGCGAYGATDFDLERLTQIRQTSIGVRRGELVKAGLVERLCRFDEDGVHPQRRPAPSGAMSAVWVITEAGREYLRRSA